MTERVATSPRWEFLLPVLLCGLHVVVLMLPTSYGLNMADEGALFAQAARVRNGELPIHDFYGYPPLRDFLVAGLLSLDESILFVRRAVALLMALLVPLYWYLLRPHVSGRFAALVIGLLALFPGTWYHRFLPIGMVLGVALLISAFRRGLGVGSSLMLGAASVLLFALRFECGLAVAVAFGVLLLLSHSYHTLWPCLRPCLRHGLAFLAGAGLAALPFAFAYSRVTTLAAMLQTQRERAFLISSHTEPIPWGEVWSLFQSQSLGEFLLRLPGLGYLLVALCLVGSIGEAIRTRGSQRSRELSLVLVFVGFSLLNLLKTGNYEYLVRVFPLPIIGGVLALGGEAGRLRRWSRAGLVMMLAGLGSTNSWYYSAHGGGLGALRSSVVPVRIPKATGIFLPAEEASLLHGLHSALSRQLSPGEAMFCFPFCPMWYFLTDTRNPTAFDWLLPGIWQSDLVEKEITRRLEGAPVTVVLQQTQGAQWVGFYHEARAIEPYLARHFQAQQHIGPYRLWTRRERPIVLDLSSATVQLRSARAQLVLSPCHAPWLLLGSGWEAAEVSGDSCHAWGNALQSSLQLRLLPPPGTALEALMYMLPASAPLPTPHVSIAPHDTPQARPSDWTWWQLPLAPPSVVAFHWGRLVSPEEVGISADIRKLGGALRTIRSIVEEPTWQVSGDGAALTLQPLAGSAELAFSLAWPDAVEREFVLELTPGTTSGETEVTMAAGSSSAAGWERVGGVFPHSTKNGAEGHALRLRLRGRSPISVEIALRGSTEVGEAWQFTAYAPVEE